MTQDEQIELMCAAWFDHGSGRDDLKWANLEYYMKPLYHVRMKAALETIDGINSLIGDSE